MVDPLKALQDQGQSVWVDFVARSFVNGGTLAQLVQEDGVCGVT